MTINIKTFINLIKAQMTETKRCKLYTTWGSWIRTYILATNLPSYHTVLYNKKKL